MQDIHDKNVYQINYKHNKECMALKTQMVIKEKELQEMTNKFNVLRCSEILQKFNVELAFK